MNVGQLIEALQEYPDYRPVFVDGAPAIEVAETQESPIFGGNIDAAPRVVIR